MQSLMRLRDTPYDFAASGWLVCLFLWMNRGKWATSSAGWVIDGFLDGHWDKSVPRKDEETVDAWMAATQVFILNWNERPAKVVFGTFEMVLACAKATGDVVRTLALFLSLCSPWHRRRRIFSR
jgi:hypothetical protein